ncbi:MAG: sodium/proline symporter [Acidobacteria bacterium]|nr:sodium/proline symporter [Acidobacteriota bacterium]
MNPVPGPALYQAAGAFVAYLVLVVAIGVYATRFSSTGVSAFFVGGRKMNRFVVALSAVVSGRSAWLLLGVTGLAYARGASAVWAVVGYIVVELLLFLFYARRLRRFSEAYDCVTVPDFFCERFEDRSGRLRALLAGIILLFMVPYVSAQFVAGGKAFVSFGLPQVSGVWLTAVIVLAYTMLGGFLAVSLTDTLQACFMIVALVVLPVVAIGAEGGLGAVLHQLVALDPTLVDPLAISAGAFLGFLGIGLGSPGNPHILARYMSISDAEQLRWAAVVGTVWNVVMGWGALFIGLAGRVYFPDAAQLPGADKENLYTQLAGQLLHPVVFGLVIASVFAAIMSTADSQLLVAASAVVRDLYEKVLRRGREVPQEQLVKLSRLVVLLLVALAVLLGFVAKDLVFWLVLFAWAGLGAALGPTSILALYWRRTTLPGVVAGLLTGAVVTVVWNRTPALKGLLYELIPAFLLSFLVTVVVSLLTRPPATTDDAFRAMDGER